MKNKDGNLVRLKHMLKAVKSILRFCQKRTFEEFEDDEILQSAVIRQFEVLGEASTNVSPDLKIEFPEVEWEKMRRFRNFLIHEYFRIDSGEVWATIQNDLPAVEEQLESIIETIDRN